MEHSYIVVAEIRISSREGHTLPSQDITQYSPGGLLVSDCWPISWMNVTKAGLMKWVRIKLNYHLLPEDQAHFLMGDERNTLGPQ